MDLIHRSDSVRTMVSRANSTSDIQRGLSHILLDAKMPDLPDDLQSLEDCPLSCQVVLDVLLQQNYKPIVKLSIVLWLYHCGLILFLPKFNESQEIKCPS